MSEVLDFGTGYDEAQSSLSALISAISEQAAQVQERSSTLDSLQQSLEQSKDQARQGLEQLGLLDSSCCIGLGRVIEIIRIHIDHHQVR